MVQGWVVEVHALDLPIPAEDGQVQCFPIKAVWVAAEVEKDAPPSGSLAFHRDVNAVRRLLQRHRPACALGEEDVVDLRQRRVWGKIVR